ncbi:MAG: FAD-dependent oxidoreductase [Allomuricauda sp.]
MYDWIVVGGGISGITVAEILCRQGKSVLLLEKKGKLAGETSKVFHEWLHTGALYTLTPDKLLTTRFLLGAIDDLLEYYGAFPRQNLLPTERGLQVGPLGWFNEEYVHYKYKNRKYNPVWSAIVSRSWNLVEKISTHDWLRRRAGALYGDSRLSRRNWFDKMPIILNSNEEFCEVKSPDVSINSRMLISDILCYALSNGLEFLTNQSVVSIDESSDDVSVKTNDSQYCCRNIIVCTPDLVSELFNKQIKISYAPIAIVKGVTDQTRSFVELDYHTKNCINLLKKGGGIGQAGGISVPRPEMVNSYIDYVVDQLQKLNPNISVIDKYVGVKKEIVPSGQERNYLYHIDQYSTRKWSLVLGKFTLAFSAAPEFYRRAYHQNPSKTFKCDVSEQINKYISKTSWQEIVDNNQGI